MTCDCIKNFKKLLKEKFNETAEVETAWFDDDTERVSIHGQYHKKNNKGVYQQKWTELNLLPKFCPFCGKPYGKEVCNESK